MSLFKFLNFKAGLFHFLINFNLFSNSLTLLCSYSFVYSLELSRSLSKMEQNRPLNEVNFIDFEFY